MRPPIPPRPSHGMRLRAASPLTGVGPESGWAARTEWPLQDDTVVRLASVPRARALLGRPDRYTAQLTPFDLTAKLQRADPGTIETYLRHAADQALPFSPEEVGAMARNVALVRAAIERLEIRLPLPPVVEVVRSTLLEEGGMAGYTRRHFVILGPRALDVRTFAHELFHVASRWSPAVRARLYRLLGVEVVAPITVPSPLDERVVTNPDAPCLDTVLRVTCQGEPCDVTMLLVSPEPYQGGPLGPYVRPCLLVLRREGEWWSAEWRDGAPRVLERFEVTGLVEQLGDNTSYDIHPEEVSAEHFVLLLAGKGDVPRRDLVEGMYEVFRGTATTG